MKQDFLAITDLTSAEVHEIFDLTRKLKAEQARGVITPYLKNQTLAMIFQKPSARTRISFEVGMYQLGGHALYLAPTEIGLGKRESAADVARVVSRYCDGIMARLYGHDLIVELAQYSSVPVINGLTDLLHPCQVMADLLTVLEHRQHLNDLTVTFVGDGNNVANSWINMASRIPMTLNLAVPEGYEPNAEILARARQTGVSQINVLYDPKQAVTGSNVIYTDVWASMGQEAEAEARKAVFRPFQVNQELVNLAAKDCLVLHCLPAHRGEEITDEVIEGPHSVVFDEAENRLHVQKAIMVRLMRKN
ncbi:ornithine carbamoyltransferase [candidate division KSB1 bacterium]|nr:ornithine carbamoyltransferase [candidate division KSB1 bacterium]